MTIVFALPSMGFGGAERVVSVLANHMAQKHEVHIVLTSCDKPAAYELDRRITVHKINAMNIFSRWFGFRKTCAGIKPDAVLCFMIDIGIFSAVSLLFLPIPVIVSERNDPTQKNRRLPFLHRMLLKIAERKVKGFVFQSNGAKEFYSKTIQKKSTIILNPINTNALPERDNNAITDKIVNVGRLHEQKNQMLLIRSFIKSKAYKMLELEIYGDGPLHEMLQDYVSRHDTNKRIHLMGNSSDLLNTIKNAKAFVLSSKYEGLPNCLLEAMCIGIPAISTDCSPGCIRMLIKDHENGLLVKNDDEDSLIVAFDYVTGHYDTMMAYAEKARAIREKVDLNQVSDEWIEFIKKCS